METTKKGVILNETSLNYGIENSGEKLVQIPKDVAIAMKSNFKNHIADFLKLKFKESYKLSLDNLEEMLWVQEELRQIQDVYDVIRIHFTHYKNEFDGRYSELSTYDNSLFLIYSRAKMGQDNLDFHAIYSVNSEIKISKTDAEYIKGKFKELFSDGDQLRPEYTSYIEIPRLELLAYFGRVLLYNKNNNSNKIAHINICLAGSLGQKKLNDFKNQKINEELLEEENEIQKLINKDYNTNQLTIIFDAETEDASLVENISYYDMNSLCPNQCY